MTTQEISPLAKKNKIKNPQIGKVAREWHTNVYFQMPHFLDKIICAIALTKYYCAS